METLKYLYCQQRRDGVYELHFQLDEIGFTFAFSPRASAQDISIQLRNAADYVDSIIYASPKTTTDEKPI